MADLNHVTGSHGLVAVDKIGNKILFLDPFSYATLLVLEGFAPRVHELAISPDHRTAFVPIYGDGIHGDNPHPGHLIAKFDLVGRRHIADFSTAPHVAPHSLRWGREGALYCVCENSGVVLRIDPERGSILECITVGSNNAHRIEILPDGSKLYTENEEDPFCSVVNLGSGRRIKDIPTPNGTAGIGLAPDGGTLVYTDGQEASLLVVDTGSDDVVRTIDLTGLKQPAQIARYSPDGQYLVVTSHEEPLGVILTSDLSEQTLVHLGKGPMDMGFHQDGETVLVANHDEGTLAIVDLKTGGVRRTIAAGEGVEILSFY